MYVYFVEEIDGDYIKIGLSKRPDERLQALQRFNGRALRVTMAIRGDYAVEREIHKRFKHIRGKGEWFKATKELKEFISDLHAVEFAGRDMLKRATAFTEKWKVSY